MTDQDIAASGPEMLKQHDNNWRTDMGAIFFGERAVLRGKNVLTDFDDSSWMEYFIYGITGKELKEYSLLMEGIWRLTTSYPDPRLWNNRVAALAGTARSSGALAIAASVSVSEATIYGLRPIKGALDFLYRAQKKIDEGLTIETIAINELKQFRSIYGYGRPLTNADERIAPFLKFCKSLNIKLGKYTKLAFDIERYLKNTRYKYQLNAAGLVAGIVADQGTSPDDHYYTGILCFTAGILPCYIDAANKKQGALFPLSSDRINYAGRPSTRKWISGDIA